MMRLSLPLCFSLLPSLLGAGPVRADNVDELIGLLRIAETVEAQHRECLDGSSKSLEAELDYELQSGDLGIEPGSEDWALLTAIYAEFYHSTCSYLDGDEIVNFYRSEFRRRFSGDEIDQLIEFHRSPLGLKLTAQWFEIDRVYGETLNQRQATDSFNAQRRFEQRMEDFWLYLEEKATGESEGQDV